jgi:hypothetical protein
MKNFDLTKYLAEGKLHENKEQGYTLYTTNVEYDNGKTGYMYQLVNSEDGEENEIGFDQLYFDDEDNRLEMGVDFEDFDQGSYQEGEYTADEAMKLYKDLAEGKLLNEAMSPQDVVDIADTVAEEFTKESADKGDFMVYSVGEMDVDDMTFELDTDVSAQTPERILKMSNLGVGEGWGGSFRINPKEEGYEVRNAEKGGLVAIIDAMGNFRMISADESRAEMGRTKGEETDYMERRRETDDYMEEGEEEVKEIKSNKMKKSELKEMIKAAMSENARTDAEEEGYLDGMRDEKEDMKEAEDVEVEDDENVDVDIEKDVDVKVDDEESEVDIDVKASMPGESEDVEEVQALLMKAQEAAQAFGDEKLTDQIGNTITYFTRSHVAGQVSEMDLDIDGASDAASPEMEAELGLEEAKDEEVKENLNESVVFPMWNKIK